MFARAGIDISSIHQRSAVPPLGSIQIGASREIAYTFFVIGMTFVMVAGVYTVLRYARYGLLALGTM